MENMKSYVQFLKLVDKHLTSIYNQAKPTSIISKTFISNMLVFETVGT